LNPKRKASTNITRAKPVLKYAGGKQQMLDILLSKAPKKYNKYIEPFIGGGALFFALTPKDAVIADSNPELINVYKVIANNVEALISALEEMKTDEKSFYTVRAQKPETLSDVGRAARTIYLNRTCFNGLYRVNRKGEFNVPYGRYSNPTICDAVNLRLVSSALQNVEIIHDDYKKVLSEQAQPGDFIFLDPPYLPTSKYSDFKRYTKEQFYEEDHEELAKEVRRLQELGCYVLLTNSNHPLVHELYSEYEIEAHKTRRNINKVATKRTGEDLLVTIEPIKSIFAVPSLVQMPEQVHLFPPTRFMGSKQNILNHIQQVASHFKFDRVIDLFSGTGAVSYMLKALGKEVISNDYMAFCASFSKAMVENNDVVLSESDIEILCDTSSETDNFVSETFKGLYYADEENIFIDTIRANLSRLDCETKRALAISSIVRACMKKRPRGIFAYTGHRYDDGRKDLALSLKEHFIKAVKQINDTVFDNGRKNEAYNCDAMEFRIKAEAVYIDPPYFSPLSDNEYVRRYHFVEGIARNWEGVEMQWHTKTRKFKSYPTPFSSRKGAHEAFDTLFRRYRNSIIIASYSSNSLPTKDEMLSLIAKYKNHVDVVPVDYRYSFANQGHKTKDIKNKVEEYIFVGY
jgi:DNA adenine methylase